ncbi:hypothetical protein BH20ACT2_BH20ACT2_10130 [soil metagenome]
MSNPRGVLGRRSRWQHGLIVVAWVLIGGVATTQARGADPTGPQTTSRPFEVAARSSPIYGIQPPSVDPARQRHVVMAGDGTELVVETWLPAAKDGNVPPEQVPAIVSLSPYLDAGVFESRLVLETMVPRGYAYANAHLRGTGDSGGCMDLFGPTEVDDSARIIEYLGRDAPWSTGAVGAYGVSYPGGTALSVAGRGDKERTRWLKAVVAGAPYHSMHEAQWTFDGVPSFAIPLVTPANYVAESFGITPDEAPNPPLGLLAERTPCSVEHLANGLDWSGDHTPWHAARDNRAWTSDIDVPTLISHGHADLVPNGGSPPSIEVGLFDQLPDTTPHVGIFGDFGHSAPPRDDFPDMLAAWFDHWLKGLDGGVDAWPAVQVQGNDGQWRAETEWPNTGGPPGQLALGPAGALGASTPTGSTTYLEGGIETTLPGLEMPLPATSAVFETAPLADRLELTGQPVLDLWVTLSLPDAHLAARIDTFDAAGRPIEHGLTYGLRSAQHLAPFRDGRFVQERGVPAPVGVPVQVPVRFQPTDLVVPAGGTLRITIAGSLIVNPGLAQLGIPEPIFLGPSQPSFLPTAVTVHHGCARPSTLRFLQPSAEPDLLTVRDGATAPPPAALVPAPASTGGGLTTAPVCGRPPTPPT